MAPIGKAKRLSLASKRAIITQIGPVEQGHYEACTGVIRKKLYELIHFLQLYNLQKVALSGIFNPFR